MIIQYCNAVTHLVLPIISPIFSSMCGPTNYKKSVLCMDQSDKVANPARESAEQGKLIVSCSRSRLKSWSRETGSAVPFRVSLLTILNAQVEPGACSRVNQMTQYGVHCRDHLFDSVPF